MSILGRVKSCFSVRWLALAVACLCVAEIAAAQGIATRKDGPPEIEYGYPDQSIFVPTLNAKGQPDSPMTRLAAILMSQAGLAWHPTPYPAVRLFKNLQDGTTNFSILVRSPALDACCLFSGRPIYGTELNVYYIGDKPPVRAKEDLVGKRVITIRGYSYAGLLKFIHDPASRIVNEVATTHKSAFDMLAAQRADYVVDYASAAGDILATQPISNLRYHSIDHLDIYLVLSRAYPDAEKLMARLEAIAKTLDVERVLKGQDK